MFGKFFSFTFIVLFALFTVFVNRGYTHDSYPYDALLPGSMYADVDGSITRVDGLIPDDGKIIHIHGIVYSYNDGQLGSHRNGDYTLALEVSAPKEGAIYDKDWWEENFASVTPILAQDFFGEGIRLERDITIVAKKLSDDRAVEYKASATLRNQVGTARDFIKKSVGEYNAVSVPGNNNDGTGNNNDGTGNNNDGTGNNNDGTRNNKIGPSNTGISLANSNKTPQPGDSVTLNLVTSEPYYYVSWYVKAPCDTSERGTYIEGDSGNGTLTEASLTYTFPSGVRHTGDFLFTASICRYADMSWYGDETHTVSVSMPTVPSRPGSFDLTAGRISIRLNWTSSASDGGSTIEAYEFQYQSSTNDRRRWSSWSTWESGGTDNFHLIQGLSRDTDYAVRMRARNSVGLSNKTGIKMIKTLR